MRYMYAHVSTNANIGTDKENIKIRTFLGEKKVRRVEMLQGVTVTRWEKVKEKLILDGNNIELICRACMNQARRVEMLQGVTVNRSKKSKRSWF